MWQVEPQSWWEEAPGLMALYPLCRHDRPAQQAVSYAAGAIKSAATDTIMRADLLTTLAIFGKLAYGQLDVIGLIGRELMKESAILAEFVDEGRVEATQADVLAVLQERFGAQAAAPFRPAIDRVTKLDKLRRLHRLAVRCASVEEFQRGLRRR